MANNWDGITFRNGDVIPEVTDTTEWASLTTPAWCYYNNDPANNVIYGKLYNWFAINDPRGFAPEGWKVPTYNDCLDLQFCGGNSVNNTNWNGLPGGWRPQNSSFLFNDLGNGGFFWSNTSIDADTSYIIFLFYISNLSNIDLSYKKDGLSVRLIKDI